MFVFYRPDYILQWRFICYGMGRYGGYGGYGMGRYGGSLRDCSEEHCVHGLSEFDVAQKSITGASVVVVVVTGASVVVVVVVAGIAGKVGGWLTASSTVLGTNEERNSAAPVVSWNTPTKTPPTAAAVAASRFLMLKVISTLPAATVAVMYSTGTLISWASPAAIAFTTDAGKEAMSPETVIDVEMVNSGGVGGSQVG